MIHKNKAIYDYYPQLQKILKGTLHTEKEDKCNHENMGVINLTRQVDKQMKNRKKKKH
jgi:hypothetical protein